MTAFLWLDMPTAEPLQFNKSYIDTSEDIWGPIRNSLFVVVPVTIIYAIIFFLGFFGNIITCVVIIRNKYMHTVTNFYLLSLAVSDFFLLTSGLPGEMYQIWFKYPYVFGETFCILQGLAAETSANATVLTITAFTIERYVAICYPFFSRSSTLKLKRTIRYILLIWVFSFVFAVPQALKLGLVYAKDENDKIIKELSICTIKNDFIPHSFQISMLLFFIVPMSIITVLYVLIGIKLYTKSSNVPSSTKREQILISPTDGQIGNQQHVQTTSDPIFNIAQCKSTKRVVKMLVAVVVAFFICWAPFQIQRLLAVYGNTENDAISNHMFILYEVVTYVSGILYYFSTVVNPILYNIMSNKFRRAFHDTLGMCLSSDMKNNRRNSGEIGSSGVPRINYDLMFRNNNSLISKNSRGVFNASFNKISDIQLRQRPLIISFRKYDCVGTNSSPHSHSNNINNVYLFERPNMLKNPHSSSLPAGIFIQRSEIKETTGGIPLKNIKKLPKHKGFDMYRDVSTFYSE